MSREAPEVFVVAVTSNDGAEGFVIEGRQAVVDHLRAHFEAPDSTGRGMTDEERVRFDGQSADFLLPGHVAGLWALLYGRDRWKESATIVELRDPPAAEPETAECGNCEGEIPRGCHICGGTGRVLL